MDSIQYAKRIQMAILPPLEDFKRYFPDSFIYYEPKDIVAGDFYWMAVQKDNVYFAVADCTGHGVTGAMVSVICSNALNKVVNEMHISEPGEILDEVQKIVINRFERSQHTVRDGMDINLIVTEKEFGRKEEVKVSYVGANNSLWVMRKDSDHIEEIKADKQPIGNYHKVNPFTTKTLTINKGDTIYMFTDGYADQFGGAKMKKLKSKNLKQKLIEIQDLTPENQKNSFKKSVS